MKAQKAMQIQQGESIFVSPERSLWDLRQAAKQAALDKKAACRFVVIHEDFYYPQMLDRTLCNEKELRELAMSLGSSITGEDDGSLRCAALWDMGMREGFLLHREGRELQCAYLPGMTYEVAHMEHSLAMRLAALAAERPDTPVLLDRPLSVGRYTIGELLHYLSEQMEV